MNRVRGYEYYYIIEARFKQVFVFEETSSWDPFCFRFFYFKDMILSIFYFFLDLIDLRSEFNVF
jgi:hypothetical protein